MSCTDYSHVLSAFARVRRTRRANTWSALCPAHEDRTPSLLLWVGRNGCLLARCFSNRGCTWQRIVAASGTNPRDWFPEQTRGNKPRWGQWRLMSPEPRPHLVATYPYQSAEGEVLYECCRFEPGRHGRSKEFRYRRPDGKGGWIWDLEGVDKVLYDLPELVNPRRQHEAVIVVEGEKDVHTLANLDFLATTNPCGAAAWHSDYAQVLCGRRVVIIPDNDPEGRAHALAVAGSCLYWQATSLRIVQLPDCPEGGDVTDWLADFHASASKHQKRRAIIEAVMKAPMWQRKENLEQ